MDTTRDARAASLPPLDSATAGEELSRSAGSLTSDRTGPGFATWATVLLLPVGPIAVAVLRLILPYYTAMEGPGMLRAVQADLGAQTWVLWLAFVGAFTLVPGLYAASNVCRPSSPKLTAWAMGLAVPGYLAVGGLISQDHILWSVAQADIPEQQAMAVVNQVHPAANVAIGIFVLGHVLGTVLLGVAMLRSQRIPAWAAWAIIVSQPLHFVATVFLGSPQVDFVGWGLLGVGLGVVGREILRDART